MEARLRHQARQHAGRGAIKRPAGGIVDIDVPAAKLDRHPPGQAAVRRDQRRDLAGRLGRPAQDDRDGQRLLTLIRRFHDATVGSELAGDDEVVCHGDLGAHNIVFDGETAVGIIDWDDGVGPGPRLVDFAHAVWCCADVCEDEVSIHEQSRKVRLMCHAYGWDDPAAVIDEIAARFRRARDHHAASGRTKAADIFEESLTWMARNGPALKDGL